MTTVMLVAAMVPIALGNGPGAGARASMAKVIIGGQMLSLVLALLVTPVFYALLDMFTNLMRRMGIRFSVQPEAPRFAATPNAHVPLSANGPVIQAEHEAAASYV
jgi:HAE1 family hydrophobic/amphiphilic exporter-1